MDTLKAMQVFVEVAKRGGFAPASRHLGLSTSSASRHVVNLEDWLGTQLLNRTTRHLSLTPAGEDLFGRCQRIVEGVDEITQSSGRNPAAPKGRLRVTMPLFMGTILMDNVVASFARAHPGVDLDLLLVDRVVNLVEDGFDLAVRVGAMTDSTLVSRKLIDMYLALVASPAYLKNHRHPRRPDDLRSHNCIIDTASPYNDRWPLSIAGSKRRFHVKGNIRVNNGAAARDLARGGAGLALLPEYLVFDDIEKGLLVTLLDEHAVDFGGVFIVYPQSRYLSSTVRSFADLLVEHSRPIRSYRDRMKAKR